MEYRRAFVPGGSYFFTLVTAERRPLLDTPEAVDLLRAACRHVRSSRPFQIDAMVVLPDHLHCIWTLPPGDADFATRWRLIKTWFTKHGNPAWRGTPSSANEREGRQVLWQRRYWEHLLQDEGDYARHVEYIHYNPVKHGLADSPGAWPYSSFHSFVRKGIYAEDWGRQHLEFGGIGGE